MKNILLKVFMLVTVTTFIFHVNADTIGFGWGWGSLSDNNKNRNSFFMQSNIGIEFIESEAWNFGLEYEESQSSSNDYDPILNQDIEGEFNANSLFVTARPMEILGGYLRFKAGFSNMKYKETTYLNMLPGDPITVNEKGIVYGFSIVKPYEHVTINLIDYQQYRTNNLSFDTVSINIVVTFAALMAVVFSFN